MTRDDPIPALKQQLGAELARLLAGWRASDICDRIGTEAARISDLRRGRLERFSLETLIRYLTRLRRRVDLVCCCRKPEAEGACALRGEAMRIVRRKGHGLPEQSRMVRRKGQWPPEQSRMVRR